MNVLTVPRAVVGAEYAVLRLPLTALERGLVGRLDEESSLRLGVEKALGTLDASVGRLLRDEDLTRRGAALSRRADVLTKAAVLEEKADARKEAAAEALSGAQREAERRRTAADEKAQRQARAVRERQQAEKRAAEQRAEATARAETEAVAREASARVAAEEQRLAARVSTIDDRTAARTATPKAQLQEAGALRTQAQRETRSAERLHDLAEKEKASRKRG